MPPTQLQDCTLEVPELPVLQLEGSLQPSELPDRLNLTLVIGRHTYYFLALNSPTYVGFLNRVVELEAANNRPRNSLTVLALLEWCPPSLLCVCSAECAQSCCMSHHLGMPSWFLSLAHHLHRMFPGCCGVLLTGGKQPSSTFKPSKTSVTMNLRSSYLARAPTQALSQPAQEQVLLKFWARIPSPPSAKHHGGRSRLRPSQFSSINGLRLRSLPANPGKAGDLRASILWCLACHPLSLRAEFLLSVPAQAHSIQFHSQVLSRSHY